MTALARVGAGGDGGGEGGAVRAVVHQTTLQLQGEVPFGAAHQDGFQEFAQGLVGDLGGDPQTGDLLLVLDHPQLLDGGTEIGQPQARGDRTHGPVAGDRQMVLLDGEGLRARGGGQIGGRDHRIAVGARQQRQPQLFVGAAVGGIAARGAGGEQDVPAGSEQQHGTRGRPAREIADVGGAGDQSGRGSDGGAPVAEQPAADGVHL